jgi:hypothetical protein
MAARSATVEIRETGFRTGRTGVNQVCLIPATVAMLVAFTASPDRASAQAGSTTNTQTTPPPGNGYGR